MSIQAKKWTDEEKETCIRLRESGLSMSEIGEHLDRSKSSVSNFLWALNNEPTALEGEEWDTTTSPIFVRQEAPAEKPPGLRNPTVTGVGDEIVAEACTENIRTLEQLMEVCNIDTEKWQIERWTANTWQVGCKEFDEEGRVRVVTKNLYQVKANMKLKPITIKAIEEIFASCSAPFVSREARRPQNEGRKLLEISVPDIHLGKLCWGKETGGADYDTNEAIDRFQSAVEDLITQEDPDDISEILLPIGNDFYNVNSMNNETANGTPQTEDSRWQKSFKKGCGLATWAIERCLQVAPVRVPIVAGNHDLERSYYLGCFLEAKFGENENVEINNSPQERKYCKFGNTIIGFTHGDRIKLKDLISLAQNEQRKAWGESKYCEWHLGHLHRESVMEDGGVIARVIPSLCPPDSWHGKHGFVMAVPAAQAFVYDCEMGLKRIHYHRLG